MTYAAVASDDADGTTGSECTLVLSGFKVQVSGLGGAAIQETCGGEHLRSKVVDCYNQPR